MLIERSTFKNQGGPALVGLSCWDTSVSGTTMLEMSGSVVDSQHRPD